MPLTQTTPTNQTLSKRRSSKPNGTSKKFSAIVETIGPPLAKRYLDSMPHNRRQRIRVKDRYVKAMAKGQWKLTGEAIKFNTRGELIDGQHRLEAIVETGKTIEILVCRNVPPEAFMELDTGATRTPSDLLTVAGYDYTAGVASAIRHITSIYKIEKGGLASGSLARERVPPKILLEYAEAHNNTLVDAVRKTMTPQAKTVLSPPSMYAALYFIFAEHNRKNADLFFDTLIDGIGYEKGRQDPVYQLRRLLAQFKVEKHKRRPAFYKCAITIKAWNAFQMRESVLSLRFKENETWPKINSRKTRLAENIAKKREKKRERDAVRKERSETAAKKKKRSS